MKRWLYIGGVLLILIAIGIYLLLANLNTIVKAAVEKTGSRATQTQVKLNEVDIEIASGKGALRGLTVGKPAGFSRPQALSLGEISIQLDPASVATDTVLIKEIVIAAPEVTYEIGTKGTNIDAYAGKSEQAKSPAEDQEGGKKLVVEHLYVRNGRVNVVAAALQQEKTVATPLPDIHLTDIGRRSGGATAAELTQQVLAAIGQGAAKAAASANVDKLLGTAKGEAADAGSRLGEAAKKFFGN